MNNETRGFAPTDFAHNREAHRWLSPIGSVPIPTRHDEWEMISDALLKAGMHGLQDSLNRRRGAILSDLSQIGDVARAVCKNHDRRDVCSVDFRLSTHLTVAFSGHGSFAPDADLAAMVDEMNRLIAYRVHPGLGDLNRSVAVRKEIYCG